MTSLEALSNGGERQAGLVLGHVFVANMTGNVVFLAFALAGASGFSILASLVALISLLSGNPVPSGYSYGLIIAPGIAMGVQNVTARKLAVPDLTTTVLTLTIVGIGADSRLAGASGSKSGRRFIAVAAMFLGAFIGSLLIFHVSIVFPLVSAFIIMASVSVITYVLSRSDPAWVRAS